MKRLLLILCGWLVTAAALAQGNLEISTPAIGQFKASMGARHAQLLPWYQSGAVGLARDGTVALREPGAVPLAQRQAVNALVAGENADRAGLYREIARANGNPGWEPDIRATFAQRWADRAPAGWWVQSATGVWQQKK
ncbi:MAG TPA: YdbL family protein [Rhodocyclaceae bacterium]|nr:YdbL family protein [Rhodocyclaceae bacterium]